MHHATFLLALVATSSTVNAIPLLQRRGPVSMNDTSTLQLALYLEHVEFALYEQACANTTDAQFKAEGFPVGFHENVCLIAEQEAVHIETISNILTSNGATPVTACNYTFPYTNATEFANLANMITSVGIGAYLGASQYFADNAALLEASASILAVEARHSTYLRTGINASPFPTAFDTGLSPAWAYNLAQRYIVSCPITNQKLGLPILPTLNVTTIPALNISAPAVINHTTTYLAPYVNTTFFNGTLARRQAGAAPNRLILPPFMNLTTVVTSPPKLAPYTNTTATTDAPRPFNTTVLPVSLPPTILQFSWDPMMVNGTEMTPLYIAFVSQNVSAPVFVQLQNVSRVMGMGSVVLPEAAGVEGVVFAALTRSQGNLTLEQLSGNATVAGPVEVVVS